MDPDHIREIFSAFGPVSVRRMFGGAGIYAGETMLALAHDGIIYLKTDEQTVFSFEREGAHPFTYTTKEGKRALMSYWSLPERLYDEPDELADWARAALAAAYRSGTRSRLPPRRSRRGSPA